MGVKQAIKILNQRKEEEQQRQIAPIKTESPRGAIANEFKNFMMQTANNINNTTRNSIETLKSRQNQTTEQDNKRLIAPVGNIENKMQNKYAGLTGQPIAPTKNDITLSEDDIKELAKKYNKTDIVTNQKTAESLQKAIEDKEQKEKIQRTEDTPIYDTGTKVKRNGKGEWEIKDKIFKEPETMTDLKDRIKKSGIDGLTFDEFKDNVVDAFDTTKYILEDSAAHGLGNVFKGIAGVGEGIDDAGHYGFAQLVKLAGNIGNNQELKDWADEIEYDTSKTGKWLQWLEEKTNDAKADSVFGNKSERVAEGVGSTIPTMVVDLLTTGGTGTIAKIGKTAGLGLMGMSSAGSSLSESYQTRGKLDGLAWIKAGIDGGTSIFVEQSGGMLGNGLSYDTKIANELTKNLKPSFKNSVISIGTRLGLSSIAEGNEEVIEAVANATTSKFANGFLDLIGDKGERYDSSLSIQEIVDNFTYGTIASLITQGGAKITQIGGNAVVNNETFNESVKQLAKAENISGQLEEKEAVLDKYEKELNKSKTSEERTKIEEKIEKTKQEIESLQANETEKDIKKLLNERIDNNKIEQVKQSKILAPVFNTEQQNNALNIPQVEQTTRATAEVYKNAFKSDADRERIVTQLEVIQNTRNKYNKNGTLNIVFDSTVNGNGVLISDKQGNRTIKLNPKTDKAAEFVLIHELTHDLKGSDAFTELSELVQSFNNKQFNFENALESIKNTYEEFYKRNNLDMSDLDTKEEAMADVLGTALGNQEFVNQLTQKPTLFQWLKNWISKQIAIHKSSDKEFTRWLYNVQNTFKKALRKNNKINTNKTNYSFAGTEAKNMNATNLLEAITLEKQGKIAQEIYENTGWYRGNEGKWRFEIDDSDFNIKDKSIKKDGWYRLEDILEANKLYEAYPELKRTEIYFEDLDNKVNGYAKPERNYIRISNELIKENDSAKSNKLLGIKNQYKVYSTLMHEIQHIIQHKENFSRGASEKYWYEKNKEKAKKTAENLPAYKNLKTIEEKNEFIENFIENNLDESTLYSMYRNTAGEQEARNVQDRIDMSSKEKKKRMPFIKNEETVYADIDSNESYHINKDFENEIDKALNNKLPSNTQLKARDYTPEILVKNGVENLPMLITQKHVKSTIYTLQQAQALKLPIKGINYHGLGKELLIKAIDNLDNPKTIYKQNDNNYLIVTEFKDKNNKEIIVPIQIKGKGLYNNVYIDENQIKSVYGRNNLEKYIKDNNFEIIYNKIEASALNEGVQYPNISNNASTNSITPTEAEVNTTNSNSTQESTKYSINSEESTLKDNRGRTLSKEQQKYFKDSKVKDEKGNLLTVYHGTPNDFTQFSYDFIGSNGTALGKGFYLTDDINIADSYGKDGKVMELYVDIKKPLSLNSINISKNEYKKFIKAVDKKTEGQFLSDYGEVEYEGYNNVLNRAIDSYDYNENDVDLVHEVFNTAGLSWEEGFRLLKDTLGYDGVIEENFNGTDSKVYVPVLPEQIKNVDNINPTNNPDIRYSQEGKDKWKEYLDFIDKKVTETKGKQEKTYFNKQLAPVKEIIQETNSAVKELKEEIGEKKKNIAPIDNDKSLDSLVDELDKQERMLTPITGKTSHAETLQEQFESLTNSKIRTERKKKKSFKDVKSEVKQTSKNLYQALVNKMQPIEDLAKKSGNKELKFTAQKILTASGQGQYNIGVAQTDINGKAIGKSVNDIFQQVIDNGKLELASEYLNLLDNSTRAERGRPIYAELNAQQSKKLAADILKENPEFKQLQKEVEKYQDNELKMLVDAGFISKADAKYIKNQNPYHVPIERIVDKKLLAPTKTITSGKGIKKARGGNSDILSSNEAIANRSMKLRRKIVLNELITEMAKAKGKYQEIANPSTQYKTEMLTDTNISEENLHFVLDGEMDVDTVFDQENDSIRISEDGKYKAVYFEDGIGHEFDITKGEYDALKQHEANAVEEFATKTLGKVSQFHKDMLTKYSLTFTAKNALKDIQDVAINTTSLTGFIKAYPKAIKQIGTDGELWNLYLANGGGNLSYFDYNTGVQATKTKNPVKIVGRAIGDVNEIVEQLPRFTEFISTLDRGGSINEAMYNAADITTNFARGGEITKALNRSGATFLNASVQGFDKFIRNFSMQNGVRPFVATLAKAAAFGMAPALLNALIYGDDEDYDRLPDSDKDLYYLFKNDSGTFIRIPKGRTLSVFGTAARRTLNYAKGDKEAFNGMLETVSNQVAPNNPITDNVIAPIIGAATNRNWYGGPIVSKRMEEKDLPKNQYDESTDDLSIAIGKKIGVSPKKINYVIDQYSGGVGDILLPVITKKASNKGNVFKDQFTTDPVLKNRYVSKFYDTVSKMTQITDDEASTEDDKLKLMYLDEVKYDVGDLYNQKREIQNSDLSNKEKSKQVREVQKQINDKVEDALDNYEKINKSTENIARIKDSTYIKLKGEWKSISDSDTEKIEKVEKSGASADDYLKYKIATYHTSDEDIDSKEKNLEKLNYIKNIPTDKIRTALYENTIGESDNNFKDYKGSTKAYLQYKIDTKEATEGNKNLKQNEKIDILLNNGYKDSDIQKLYENQIKSDEDLIYDSLKDTIDIKEYLKYKQQDFSSDKLDDGTLNGKTVSGSSQKKVYNYINSMNISREEKLILIGSKYKLTNTERTELAQYINTLSLNKKDKLELYSKMKGFTVYKDGRVTW